MRPALSFLLPASEDRRRNRTLATLTAVAAAAGIAAVTATGSQVEDGLGAGSGPGAAAGADAEVEDGDPRAATLALPRITLPEQDRAPRDGAASPTGSPIGHVERLSAQQDLPSLPDARDGVPEAEPADDAPAVYETADGELIDAGRVVDFLDGRDAPLAAYAETIVAAGVEHDVDPRVVVGIAIAESNGAEMKPAGTHNAWGWGGNGPRGLRAWDSWEESIDGFTERLGALYDTDNVDWEFARTYCPPNTQWWYDTVTWARAQI